MGENGPASRRDALAAVAAEAGRCRRCPLWRNATQTVFGHGPPAAPLMLVGEQPGDQEDRQGAPFVGPAGRLLRASLEEAGLAADRTYLTNVVKHFKWEPRGKRRMHKTPAASEIAVCRAWLDEEIRLVQPRFVVALGSTAAAALFGSSVRVTRDRGSLFELADGTPGTVTVHPSSILRAGSSAAREEARLAFVTDLRRIGRRAGRL